MAYWIDATSPIPTGGTRTLSFIADTDADINNMPTSSKVGTGGISKTDDAQVEKGSSCIVISSGSVYMLNSYDMWVKL